MFKNQRLDNRLVPREESVGATVRHVFGNAIRKGMVQRGDAYLYYVSPRHDLWLPTPPRGGGRAPALRHRAKWASETRIGHGDEPPALRERAHRAMGTEGPSDAAAETSGMDWPCTTRGRLDCPMEGDWL